MTFGENWRKGGHSQSYIGRTFAISIKRLALEMFQIMNSDGCLRLSHMFKQVNSLRKGKLIEMKTTTSEFGRQSL